MILRKSGVAVSGFAFARVMRATVAGKVGEKQLAADLRASLADYFLNRSYKTKESK